MDEELTEEELVRITQRKRPSAQQRQLNKQGIYPIVDAEGGLHVTWHVINAAMLQASKPARRKRRRTTRH